MHELATGLTAIGFEVGNSHLGQDFLVQKRVHSARVVHVKMARPRRSRHRLAPVLWCSQTEINRSLRLNHRRWPEELAAMFFPGAHDTVRDDSHAKFGNRVGDFIRSMPISIGGDILMMWP